MFFLLSPASCSPFRNSIHLFFFLCPFPGNRLNYYVGGEIVTVSHMDRCVACILLHFRSALANALPLLSSAKQHFPSIFPRICSAMYLLGYLQSTGRVYLGDRDLTIISYTLPLAVLEYQTLVMRGNFEAADEVMPRIPAEQRTRVAQFLEKRGYKEQALVVSTDPDHRYAAAAVLFASTRFSDYFIFLFASSRTALSWRCPCTS